MIHEISSKIQTAEKNKQKLAMFHYQVLVNAKELRELDPVQFCIDIGVPESYAAEFRKMRSLSNLMDELGTTISIV